MPKLFSCLFKKSKEILLQNNIRRFATYKYNLRGAYEQRPKEQRKNVPKHDAQDESTSVKVDFIYILKGVAAYLFETQVPSLKFVIFIIKFFQI